MFILSSWSFLNAIICAIYALLNLTFYILFYSYSKVFFATLRFVLFLFFVKTILSFLQFWSFCVCFNSPDYWFINNNSQQTKLYSPANRRCYLYYTRTIASKYVAVITKFRSICPPVFTRWLTIRISFMQFRIETFICGGIFFSLSMSKDRSYF